MSARLKKIRVRVYFLRVVFSVRFVAKVSEGTNRSLSGYTTFSPVGLHRLRKPQCTALQTDGQHDNVNSRSYCVAVQSAKKSA